MDFITSASQFTPKMGPVSLDFQEYLNSLISNIFVAMLIFFAFVLTIYLLVIGIQYFVFILNYLRQSKHNKQKYLKEQPVEGMAV